MHVALINQETANDDNRKLVLATVENSEGRKRVFSTFVPTYSTEYELMTTNKDVHLGFGAMQQEVQKAFCFILEEEFEKAQEPSILVSIQLARHLKENYHPDELLITRVVGKEHRIGFHVSVAR